MEVSKRKKDKKKADLSQFLRFIFCFDLSKATIIRNIRMKKDRLNNGLI